MISNKKVINNKVVKVVEVIEIYNFYFGHVSIRLYFNNSKFEFQNMTTLNRILGQ